MLVGTRLVRSQVRLEWHRQCNTTVQDNRRTPTHFHKVPNGPEYSGADRMCHQGSTRTDIRFPESRLVLARLRSRTTPSESQVVYENGLANESMPLVWERHTVQQGMH